MKFNEQQQQCSCGSFCNKGMHHISGCVQRQYNCDQRRSIRLDAILSRATQASKVQSDCALAPRTRKLCRGQHVWQHHPLRLQPVAKNLDPGLAHVIACQNQLPHIPQCG
jgi:hypothetical protein